MSIFSNINADIGKVINTVGTVNDLRAMNLRKVSDGDTVMVSANLVLGDGSGGVYVWSDRSTLADDGTKVLRPSGVTGMGRWLLSVGSGSAGPAGPQGQGLADVIAPTGSALVGYQLASNAANRTVADRLKGLIVTPEDFTGSAATRFASAFNFAGVDGSVQSLGSYDSPGFVMPTYSKLEGNWTIYRQGTDPIVTINGNEGGGIQTSRQALLSGGRLMSRNPTTNARQGIGIRVANHAALRIEDMRIETADVGVYLDRTQFTNFDSLKVYDSNIGVYARPSLADGGANSFTFDHLQVNGCMIGLMLDNSGNQYPQGDIVLLNPQFLGNKVAAIASIGVSNSARTQLYIYGMAPEANALSQATAGYNAGPASYTYNGIVVPRSSMYLKYTSLSIFGGSVAEYGATNPCIILESSLLSLHDVTGYGGPASTFVQADNDSQVVISGFFGCIGAVHGVSKFDATLDITASSGAIVGPITRKIAHNVTNDFVTPALCDIFKTPNVTSSGQTDLPEGPAQIVTFKTIRGDAGFTGQEGSNAAFFSVNVKGNGATGRSDRVVISMMVMADRDCQLRYALYPNESPVYVSLKANKEVLVTYYAKDIAIGSQPLVIYPNDTTGPVVRFRNGHCRSGLLADQLFNSDVSAICGGAYNPKVAALVPYQTRSTIPTDNTRPSGAIVWNSAPAVGQPTFWQHVGNGVWKAVNLTA